MRSFATLAPLVGLFLFFASPPVVSAYALTVTRLLPAKVRVFIDYLVANMAQADQRRT
jgi:hypothetical protein